MVRVSHLIAKYVSYSRFLERALGDIVYISAMGKPIILLGTHDVANQLLMKRGTVYSNRPTAPFNDQL